MRRGRTKFSLFIYTVFEPYTYSTRQKDSLGNAGLEGGLCSFKCLTSCNSKWNCWYTENAVALEENLHTLNTQGWPLLVFHKNWWEVEEKGGPMQKFRRALAEWRRHKVVFPFGWFPAYERDLSLTNILWDLALALGIRLNFAAVLLLHTELHLLLHLLSL